MVAAQAIGLDVRCGLHTGELERIDGRLGGIAAHIGARVMARAAAAEVLVTATVRELATGGGMEFGPADETELKGVPGLFRLHRLLAIDGQLLPAALIPVEARARLTPHRPPSPRAPLVAGVAALALVAVAGVAAVVLRPGAGPASPIPSASPGPLVTMLKVNPETNKVVRQVRDRHVSVGGAAPITAVDGTLWQVTPISIVQRDIDTGAATAVFDLPAAISIASISRTAVRGRSRCPKAWSPAAWRLTRSRARSGSRPACLRWLR